MYLFTRMYLKESTILTEIIPFILVKGGSKCISPYRKYERYGLGELFLIR